MNGQSGGEVSRRTLTMWLTIFAAVFFSAVGWVGAGLESAKSDRLEDVQRITRLERDQAATNERVEMIYSVIGERLKAIDAKLERIAERR